ncbi:aminotransferase class V-fold PLP-dependent enzyme [Desulfovibrio sp. OttesenSCG-928-M14]|nr:aminotransferase class V-fold PLP-dependent enzyme [Desulfovibrio sp. OttesenSCG-928-M14]
MPAYAPIPMLPGPVTVPESVLAAMNRDYGSGQVEEDFLDLYAKVGKGMARLMGTGNDVVLMTGEGMLALWAALKSCLKPGDAVLSVGTGVFGDGIADMAASLGCKVEKLSLPYNSTIGTGDSLERIEKASRRLKPLMLTAVHCETPSGSMNPLDGLGEIKQRLGIPLFYVDAVASVGGAPVSGDAWHIDLLLTGSQKCLSAPPSMSMIAVSETAWDIMGEVNYQGYDSILPFRTVQQDGRCPYTPYWHGVAALYAALQLIEAEGDKAVFARHQQVARQCREGLRSLGLELFVQPQSTAADTVTAALVPPTFAWPEWRQRLRERGLIVSGSFGPMAGKVFRLGHMGSQANTALMDKALGAIQDVLPNKR